MPPAAAAPAFSLETARQKYVANLSALYRVDVELAAAIEATPFALLADLEATRDGRFTRRVVADDGARIYVHSKFEPQRETDGWMRPLIQGEPRVYVLCGGGLGYALETLEAEVNEPTIVLLEDDLALLKAACCLHDLADRLIQRRLVVVWQADRAAVHRQLGALNAALTLGLVLLPHSTAGRCHAAFQTQARQLVSDYAAFLKTQIVTLLRTSRATFRNVAWNLPHYLRQPGVQTLAGAARGRPAIVVAAGPSLARQLDALRSVKDRAVIISVQTVYKLLREVGIQPHFVTSLDFHEISGEFFRGAGPAGRSRLVAEPKAAGIVLETFPGEKYVLHHRFIDVLLREAAPPRGGLRGGSTVAHLAFYLAEHLGCDPILFVGQDLAFSDGLFYLPGSPIEDIWRPELGRFQTIEMKQWERIVRNRGILKPARDLRDQPIYTDDLLTSYAEQFAKDIAQCKARVVQIGEHGLRLPGADAMSFGEAARGFMTHDLGDAWRPAWSAGDYDVARAAGALGRRIEETRQVRAIADEMSGLLTRLGGLLERPAEFNRLVAQVDALRTRMSQFDAMYQLVVEVSTRANLRRYSADRAMGRVGEETAEVAAVRLKRDAEFVAGLIDGCDFVLDVLPGAQERLAQWDAAGAGRAVPAQ